MSPTLRNARLVAFGVLVLMAVSSCVWVLGGAVLHQWGDHSVTFNYRLLRPLDWVYYLVPPITIAFALGGLLARGWSFTSSVFWRSSCLVLPIFPVSFALATISLDPDALFGSIFFATPVYILIGLVFSAFAKGMRLVALAVNSCLGFLWMLAINTMRPF